MLAIVGLVLEDRDQVSPDVQRVLAQYGRIIRGRMGVPDPEHQRGIVTLVVESEKTVVEALSDEVGKIPGVHSQWMSLA